VPAYAYLRKSSLPPGANSMSPQAQEDAVRALAKVHGDEADIVLLADWDISGADKFTAKRRGWQELIAAVEDGLATAVYSYSLSRLARSTTEVLAFFKTCAAHHVPVRIVADSVDTSTASGKMMLTILASVAQFESDVSSERRLAANQARRDRGEAIVTDRPFGQKPGEDAAAVVAAFRETRSYTATAKLLNARGVKPRRALAWRASSVIKVIALNAPDLVAPRTVKRVKAGGQSFALARLLRCGACGGLLTGRHVSGTRRTQYYCSRAGTLAHQRATISERSILPAVRAEVERITAIMASTKDHGDPSARRQIEAERERIRDAFQDGLIDKADLAKRLHALAERDSRLESRRILKIARFPVFESTDDPRSFEAVVADPPAVINVFLRRLFDRIDLDAATFQPTHFEWTFPEWRRA